MKCIQLDNLHLEYQRGKIKALNGLNLQIDQGSFWGLWVQMDLVRPL